MECEPLMDVRKVATLLGISLRTLDTLVARREAPAFIRIGYAWYAFQFAYEMTSEQRLAYPEAERRAKAEHIGLWQEPDPMPPWECRRLIRARKRDACR